MKTRMYKVRWWGCPGSRMSRPNYYILDIDNSAMRIRHCIIPGRPLGNYTLPYWPIRSYLSFLDPPAELAHQVRVRLDQEGSPQDTMFVMGDPCFSHSLPRRAPPCAMFHLAEGGQAKVLMITNEGSRSPILMEHYFGVVEGRPEVRVIARSTNATDRDLVGVQTRITYEQDFNWSDFGTNHRQSHRPASGSGSAKAFYVFSAGMKRGFEFVPLENCHLTYQIAEEGGRWQADLVGPPNDMAPGQSSTLEYALRLVRELPNQTTRKRELPCFDPLSLRFTIVTPKVFRKAKVHRGEVTTIAEMLAKLGQPKVRGLNLRASPAQALADIETLSRWGCNLLVTGMSQPQDVPRICRKAHSLGMRVLLEGSGGCNEGPPSFDSLKRASLGREQLPDSYGQDEDHYYWHPIRSSRDFLKDFGKHSSHATQEERVCHFARCFADKWRAVLADVREMRSEAGVWFYTPCPGVANVDPLDYYDILIGEVSRLGRSLTVFPFYYGIDYDQVQYMVRRWKSGGASSVVFLPMRDFMTKPSQFVRAITAARKGGADGACGFSFQVGECATGEEWQWKSVMLGEWANFPTPDLKAFCCMEEPAELVEGLAADEVTLVGPKDRIEGLASRLDRLLPGGIATASKPPTTPWREQLAVVIDENAGKRIAGLPEAAHEGQGFLSMEGGTVGLESSDSEGTVRAIELFLRFAELACAEAGGGVEATRCP